MTNTTFAFIVHSRDRKDLLRKYPWLKLLPSVFFDKLTMFMRPFVVSNISGLRNISNGPVKGLVIGIPMTAQQLLEHREKGLKKIFQAVNLAKSKGALFVGLGAMTASLSRGGQDVIENISDVYVTTGRTYTIKNITEYVECCVNLFNLNKRKIIIGIIGAAGGIGSGVIISLINKGFRNFILIDLERKLTHIEGHLKKIKMNSPDTVIDISHKIELIAKCIIVIGATSAPEVVIRSRDVTPGTIIINDAQPSDVSPEVLTTRNDVLVIEGGVLYAPEINCHFDFGLACKNDIFSCLAETLLLAHRDVKEHYSIGEFDPNFLKNIQIDSQKLNFKISKFQNDYGYIEEKYLKNFATIMMMRNISQ